MPDRRHLDAARQLTRPTLAPGRISESEGASRRGLRVESPKAEREGWGDGVRPFLEVCGERSALEASFSLTLTGTQRSECESGSRFALPLPESGCSFQVVHRVQDGEFTCFLRGWARAPSEAEVRDAAWKLWQNLEVVLGATDHPTCLPRATPIGAPVGRRWLATAQPAGVGIDLVPETSVGFLAPEPSVTTVLLDCPSGQPTPSLDALAILSGVHEHLELRLSLERLELDSEQIGLLETVMEHLARGDEVRYGNGGEVRDDTVLGRLQADLESWRRDPAGFRLSCTVFGAAPPAASLLGSLARQLYGGEPVRSGSSRA